MCFTKSANVVPMPVVKNDPVIRQEADALVTKNSNSNISQGFKENLKTSVFGLDEEAKISKKTLLGE